MGKIFVIGDIHGCIEKLRALMDSLAVNPENDTLVFIGDYIDRGKYSKDVVDYVLALQKEYRHMVCLLGNHEKMFLRYLEGMEEEIYLGNGGINTLASYNISLSDGIEERKRKIPDRHREFFASLLAFYETDDYLFVHAGIRPGIPVNEQSTDDLLWIRYEFIQAEDDFGKTVVFGHTPMAGPFIAENKIGIDTGAVYGGKLTCVELPAMKIYQV